MTRSNDTLAMTRALHISALAPIALALFSLATPGCVAEAIDPEDAEALADDLAGDEPVAEAEQALAPKAPIVDLIAAKHSAKCLDVWEWSTANAAPIKQWPCTGGSNQRFKMIATGEGYYQIRSMHSDKCLDVAGASMDSGAIIQQYDCWYGDNQRFKPVSTGDGYVRLVAKHSGKCLDVYNGDVNGGASVVQWDCNDNPQQRFYMPRAQSDKGACASSSNPVCTPDVTWLGEGIVPSLNCTYGYHVGVNYGTGSSGNPFYDAVDRCAYYHDKDCWRVNHATWVDEGFGGCSQTVNFIACVEQVAPASHEELVAKECIMNSLLKMGADICEPLHEIFGRGFLYPLYDGATSGGACGTGYYPYGSP